MEIYLKKEHLHYTGSVKERGVLYLLTSLTQVQPILHCNGQSSLNHFNLIFTFLSWSEVEAKPPLLWSLVCDSKLNEGKGGSHSFTRT